MINDKGQYLFYGKVGGTIITGNGDGVKHCAMGVLYALQHLGYSIPPQADAGWIGEVGPGPSYGDTEWNGKKLSPPLGTDSDFTNKNTTFMTYNLLHLASTLKEQGGYPSYGNSREPGMMVFDGSLKIQNTDSKILIFDAVLIIL